MPDPHLEIDDMPLRPTTLSIYIVNKYRTGVANMLASVLAAWAAMQSAPIVTPEYNAPADLVLTTLRQAKSIIFDLEQRAEPDKPCTICDDALLMLSDVIDILKMPDPHLDIDDTPFIYYDALTLEPGSTDFLERAQLMKIMISTPAADSKDDGNKVHNNASECLAVCIDACPADPAACVNSCGKTCDVMQDNVAPVII